ncbi:MAG TPA: helix-hairpin-helix domain-containing protein [Bdellovibrionota bacterium]|nr:helix-hairpin-helix domain-containing protein [Bdellovibrionota bacterium]
MVSTASEKTVEILAEIRACMELKGENVFKIRAYEKAEKVLHGRDDIEARAKAGTLTELQGIGKGIAAVVEEFLKTGRSEELEELRKSIPPALRELSRVPGLGPKKAQTVMQELGIQSLGELEYACRENRLAGLKGFGEKMQAKILEGVQFAMATQGQLRWVDAQAHDRAVRDALRAAGVEFEGAGAFRRRLEVISDLEYVVKLSGAGPKAGRGGAADPRAAAEEGLKRFLGHQPGALPVKLHFAEVPRFGTALARATGTPEHWAALGKPDKVDAPTEEAFYAALKLPYIEPELRETGEEVALARAGGLKGLLPWNGVRGVFHNHTVESDGVATLEEMVAEARRLGFAYIGISDHSQSAFYARGLKSEALTAQEKAIRKLQEKYDDIRIFWGVESDILQDGSLDYPDEVLARMDFVIASIHSRFQMDKAAMTERILTAVRNPRTTMLGHLTGRLLLGRKGYDMDFEQVFAECTKRKVVVEINAHPQRLDVDWRWGPRLRALGVNVSVNPDAHEVAGLSDVVNGVAVARKALLPAAQVVNSRDAAGVERWLRERS